MIRSLFRTYRIQKLPKLFLIIAGISVAILGVVDQWLLPFPEDKLFRPHSTFIYSREGKLLNAFTSVDKFWRKPVTLEQISPKLIKSVINTEDRYFYLHPGINPISLVNAAVTNIKKGRVVRGGSTITMQIARMIEPKARTVPNKLFEMFRAMQLELRYSKVEILEMYFNLLPYGGNIEGVGAASHFYFDKEPTALTWSEAAILAAIPGSPEKLRPDKCLACGKKRSKQILNNLLNSELISSQEYLVALTEELPSRRLSFPKIAPHLTVSLQISYPDSSSLQSTVNYEAQLVCERLATVYRQKLENKDIYNLAIVVIDNSSAEIRALVGSPDFNDKRHSGQVDASAAPRSPGSTLKPFAYALAFDNGILSPQQMVADIPVNYSGYRPVNYDESYRGIISVRDALIHSLNVPAVNATADIGLQNLYSHLQRGGISTLNRRHYEYGLPLILGACEIKLTELTNLYATLARDGIHRPIKTLLEAGNNHGVRIFSEGACYLLSDILVDLKRPDLPDSWEFATGRFPIAWKTGTSYGRRDAWAIGYNPEYTVGIWVGNCSGEGSVDLVGASAAAPILFDVFSEIVTESEKVWYLPSPEVGQRSVCGLSGQPVSRFCREKVTEKFLIGKSPSAICSVHRPITVDRQSGLRLRASCTDNRDSERRIIEQWPQAIASWLVENGMSSPLPPYDPTCYVVNDGLGPRIISPEQGAVFEFAEEILPEYQKIRLQASVASGDGKVHWFLDGKHLEEVRSSEITFYTPRKGKHYLLCMDDAGRSSSVNFTVH